MAGYFPTLLAKYIPAQGVAGGTCDYDAEVRGAASNLSQKKEGVDILRSTNGQTPKKEGVGI